ncbi:MAG: class I SAM-dependent rRNA methyltransferase [Thermodesulfobacteriota bacterium]|jgi:23S rRNA (cytosine1962-C5)-methyltransferase
MNQPRAILTPKGERWFRSGHPWIFRDDVFSVDKTENGDITALFNHQNTFLGWAFYSRFSRITFRIITSQPHIIDQAYWRVTLQKAIEGRKTLLDHSQACRIVFSEADGIPGLIADWYAGHLVIQTLIPGTDNILDKFNDIFHELLHPTSILIRNDLEARKVEHLPQEVRTISGQVHENIRIQEGSVQYWVSTMEGQKTGAYLDQRENRLHLGSCAQSHGKVLDCFCYTGGFALHLAPKAEEIIAVDDSAPTLELGRKNAELNGFSNIHFQKKNVFDYLKEADKQGQRFDLIVLDPPPFARKKSDISAALRGYQELNRRALRCLNLGGILNTYSCSYNVTQPIFLEILSHSVQKARVRAHLLEKRIQAGDHPILMNFPESYYLKGLTLKVI